jgi:ketosteroid isomerase-like protein
MRAASRQPLPSCASSRFHTSRNASDPPRNYPHHHRNQHHSHKILAPQSRVKTYTAGMRNYWACTIILAFLLGMAVDNTFRKHLFLPVVHAQQNPDLAGIEKLHRLDEQLTLLNDPKALQEEWADDAVRLEAGSPVDVGKSAIYASDARFMAQTPGYAIVSYKPDIRDVRVDHDWAFEWGLFDVGFRESANEPVKTVHGKLLRVLHREHNGDWKFARIMVVEN